MEVLGLLLLLFIGLVSWLEILAWIAALLFVIYMARKYD